MIKEYLYTNFSLNERTALVTGSARGIGLAISTALGRAGAQVIINDLNESACIESVDKLKAEGIRASYLTFDVSDHESVCIPAHLDT